MKTENRIFLAHASEDKPQVRQLYEKLKARGFAPWLDAVDLIPGQNWREEIPKAIREATICLACLSKRSVAKSGYVQREFKYALSAYADRPPGSIYLIPVRLDEYEVPDLRIPDLELSLKEIQQVDLFEADGFERLVKAIQHTLAELPDAPEATGGNCLRDQLLGAFEALQAAAKAAAGNNPAADAIKASLDCCVDDLKANRDDRALLTSLPDYLAGLAKDIEEHLLERHFEAVPVTAVLAELEALSGAAGVAGEVRINTLNHRPLVDKLVVEITQALGRLPTSGLDAHKSTIADRELRRMRREVTKPRYDAETVSGSREQLEGLKVNLVERTTLLAEAVLGEDFPNLPIRAVFRDLPELWCPEMVLIPTGTFLMGSPDDERSRDDHEGPQHKVTISQAFALGRYPVTFDEYDHFCEQTHRKKQNEGWGRRGRRPVINVSQRDAQYYCAWLSDVTNALYRLPTEAQWEYACRAGTTTAYAFGDKITKKQAQFDNVETADVGSHPANSWGLFDMHGNVWEWCGDDGKRKYTKASMTDPQGFTDAGRVLRGGSWFSGAQGARSAYRDASDPGFRNVSIGFRCARV